MSDVVSRAWESLAFTRLGGVFLAVARTPEGRGRERRELEEWEREERRQGEFLHG